MVAVKAGTGPVPLFVPSPIASFVRDQLNTAPGIGLVNTTEGTDEPVQYVWLATALTLGTGLTVMVNEIGAPVHTAPVVGEVTGVTVIVAVSGAFVAFVAVNEAISPLPDAARPMPVLLFVQLNTVPATEPLKVTAVVDEPVQTVWLDTAFTSGVLTTGRMTVANGRQAGSVGFWLSMA